MKKAIIYLILILLFVSAIFFYIISNIAIPRIEEIAINQDPTLRAGYNESCITPAIEIDCQEGLECVLISSEPYKNGICLKDKFELEEDLVNRPDEIGLR